MSQIQAPKKLRTEDFDSKYQDIISKVAFVVNPFFDSIYYVLNGNIDFFNLNRAAVSVTVSIDSSGKLIGNPQVKTSIVTKIKGLNVINAVNSNSTDTYPVSAPFVSWSASGGIITILNVTGLQNSSEYVLTLEVIG
jgi:hypothetical protein